MDSGVAVACRKTGTASNPFFAVIPYSFLYSKLSDITHTCKETIIVHGPHSSYCYTPEEGITTPLWSHQRLALARRRHPSQFKLQNEFSLVPAAAGDGCAECSTRVSSTHSCSRNPVPKVALVNHYSSDIHVFV